MSSGASPGSPLPQVQPVTFTTLATPTTQPFDVEKAQEKVRHWLTGGLLAIFGGIIFCAFVTVWINHGLYANVKDVFTVALSASGALLGSAIGFYFGSHK